LGLALGLFRHLLVQLALQCDAVVCCRVSPIQKAQVVKLVKWRASDAVTLAIGDGANDVSMIQEADVGIGIRGREGSQAVRASDYGIAKFRFLKRLLLVHGRYNYLRVTTLIQYSFYKNIAFTLPQFYFSWFNGFSGQTLYDSWIITVYNMIFTALPVIFFAIFDKDINEEDLEKYPELYNRSKDNKDLNAKTFFLWMVNAVWHSLVFYFGAVYLWRDGIFQQDGQAFGIWELGLLCTSVAITTVSIKIAQQTSYWIWLNHVAIWGSVAIYFLGLYPYSLILFLPPANMYYVMFNVSQSLYFWLAMIALISIAMLPDFIWATLKGYIFPQDWQIIREFNMIKKTRKRPSIRETEKEKLIDRRLGESDDLNGGPHSSIKYMEDKKT